MSVRRAASAPAAPAAGGRLREVLAAGLKTSMPYVIMDNRWDQIRLAEHEFYSLAEVNNYLKKNLGYSENEFVERGSSSGSSVHFEPPPMFANTPNVYVGPLINYDDTFTFRIRGVEVYFIIIDDVEYGRRFILKHDTSLYR